MNDSELREKMIEWGEETIDEYLSLADQNMYRQKQMRKSSRRNSIERANLCLKLY